MAGPITPNAIRRGGGAPIVLLPGWPQSWYAWRHVMPLLSRAGRRVIALDPRGMGDSDRPVAGYDMRTVAAELHGFVEALRLTANGPIDIVGHDLGTWIGYAHASEWPDDVKRLAVFDAALPGISPRLPAGIPSAEANLRTWHLAFNRLDDLPEMLLQGREREFMSWMFRVKSARPWTITPADLDEYVRVNAPGAIRAALSYQRHTLGPEGVHGVRVARRCWSSYALFRDSEASPRARVRQRRSATIAHTASTSPNGQAP
ncbi:MAG TPA: alpha/beta fold hydrolase [Gemmatimonadaceae bacterium]|nr:alpha/beta fold hydrolase [Gemmatimonadaceae bacterium]